MKTDQYYVNPDTFLQKLRSNLSENGENYVTWLIFTTPKYISFGFQFKNCIWNSLIEPRRVREDDVDKAIKRILLKELGEKKGNLPSWIREYPKRLCISPFVRRFWERAIPVGLR
jgi:hypothetical protein